MRALFAAVTPLVFFIAVPTAFARPEAFDLREATILMPCVPCLTGTRCEPVQARMDERFCSNDGRNESKRLIRFRSPF